MRKTIGEKMFHLVSAVVLVVAGLCALLPFVHVIAKSLSADVYVISNQVVFWPKGFNVKAYEFAMKNTPILSAFANTVFVTVVGTVLSLVVSAAAAYPLSLPSLKGRKPFLYFFVFTMLFNGGMIPAFLLMKQLNLINSLWSMILPHVLEVYNLLLIKNYFEGLPDSIRESAQIDGANDIQIFGKIILPMSKPILATMGVFYAVGYWNSYFNAMLYLSDQKKMTLQLFLVNIVKQAQILDGNTSEIIVQPDTVRAATVIIGTLPILLVYPLLQKYFVQGVTLGSVKG